VQRRRRRRRRAAAAAAAAAAASRRRRRVGGCGSVGAARRAAGARPDAGHPGRRVRAAGPGGAGRRGGLLTLRRARRLRVGVPGARSRRGAAVAAARGRPVGGPRHVRARLRGRCSAGARNVSSVSGVLGEGFWHARLRCTRAGLCRRLGRRRGAAGLLRHAGQGGVARGQTALVSGSIPLRSAAPQASLRVPGAVRIRAAVCRRERSDTAVTSCHGKRECETRRRACFATAAAVGVPLAVNAPGACHADAATTGVAGGAAAAAAPGSGASSAAAAARRSGARLNAAARCTVSCDNVVFHFSGFFLILIYCMSMA